jgi:hypothetical protein
VPRTRRTKEETQAAFDKAKQLIADGKSITEAQAEAGIASSVYARYAKGFKPKTNTRAAKRAANPKKGSRRTMAEVASLVEQAKALVDDEKMTVSEACDKVGIPTSNYYRHVPDRKRGHKRPMAKRADGLRRANGSMKISALPPRPKKGGFREPKRINPNDVGQVAHRISVLDRKIKRMVPMQMERKRLAQRLLIILKNF